MTRAASKSHVRDGAVRHVRGDRSHPVSRGSCVASAPPAITASFWIRDVRLTKPLCRMVPRARAALRVARWDEAIAVVADRLGEIAAEDPGAILNAHYTGTFALLGYAFRMRFLRRSVHARSIRTRSATRPVTSRSDTCTARRRTVLIRAPPRRRCILVWGANPSASAPHRHEHWLPEAPGRVIVVDPLATETARQADLHLQPFPGTDAALAFAIAHVLRRDGLLDEVLLAAHASAGTSSSRCWRLHSGLGSTRHRRARRRHRARGHLVRRRAVAAVDRSGIPAPAARRQRRARASRSWRH